MQTVVCIPSHGSTVSELYSGCNSDDTRSISTLSLIFTRTNCSRVTVHALYGRNRRIAVLLGSLLVVQVSTMVFCVIFTVRELTFDALCLPTNAPRPYLPLAYVA